MEPNLLLFPDDHGDAAFFRAVQHYGFFAIAGIVDRMYGSAVEEGNRLFGGRPERRRMIGHIRHSLIEEEVRKLDGRIEGVSATSQPYCNNSGSFSLLKIDDALVSVSCVKNPSTMPREAEFRAALRRINQWTLGESTDGNGPRQHILVIHGPTVDDWSQTEFIYAAKPDPSGAGYIQVYDLRQHPGALVLPTPAPAAPTLPAAKKAVTLKRRTKIQNEE